MRATKEPDVSLIYPGIHKTVGVNRTSLYLKSISAAQKINPSVSVIESPDDITIRISAPGFLRDEFVVIVKNCRLSVYALHRKLFRDDSLGKLPEKFDYYFSRRLQLPANVDPDFVSAEYKNGILCMRFLKSYHECECKRHQVAVY